MGVFPPSSLLLCHGPTYLDKWSSPARTQTLIYVKLLPFTAGFRGPGTREGDVGARNEGQDEGKEEKGRREVKDISERAVGKDGKGGE